MQVIGQEHDGDDLEGTLRTHCVERVACCANDFEVRQQGLVAKGCQREAVRASRDRCASKRGHRGTVAVGCRVIERARSARYGETA
jgi:hypothetical protein